MAAQIITVTVNPALDVSTAVAEVVADHKLRCGGSRVDPGGGGVNVARVVRRLGGRSLAVYTAGGPIGQAYCRLVEAERVPSLVVPVAGDTRQSFTVDERTTGRQFRYVLEGPELADDEWRTCLDFVAQTISSGSYVVASGSLPPGVPDDFYARVARLAREAGARCVVDAQGAALSAALAEGTFLVKPSRHELETHLGRALEGEASQVDAVAALIAAGSAECVALTLGAGGAVLATRDGVLRRAAPSVEAVSAVGAGDSFLAGLVLRLAQERTAADALRTAVAAGAATVMTPATALCRRADVERLEAAVPAAA